MGRHRRPTWFATECDIPLVLLAGRSPRGGANHAMSGGGLPRHASRTGRVFTHSTHLPDPHPLRFPRFASVGVRRFPDRIDSRFRRLAVRVEAGRTAVTDVGSVGCVVRMGDEHRRFTFRTVRVVPCSVTPRVCRPLPATHRHTFPQCSHFFNLALKRLTPACSRHLTVSPHAGHVARFVTIPRCRRFMVGCTPRYLTSCRSGTVRCRSIASLSAVS